jgi:lipopolysaccharide biosynthesis regulator YciM
VTDEGGAPDTTPTERAIALFETLPPYAPVAGRYNQADRYRDFRKVLIEGGASVAEARRVLWQIFEETRLFHTPIGGAADTHATYARIGKQEIGRWLLTVLTAAPSDAGPVP